MSYKNLGIKHSLETSQENLLKNFGKICTVQKTNANMYLDIGTVIEN